MRKISVRHWPFFVTGPVLSLVLIVFWFFNQQHVSGSAGPVLRLLENPMLTFGPIILGGFMSAFLGNEFSFKVPLTYEPLVLAFCGGVLMGWGAGLAALSVHSVVLFNLAGIFTLTAFMITKGWIYAVFMILGGWAGSRLFLRVITRTQTLKKELVLPAWMRSATTLNGLFAATVLLLSALLVVIFSSARLGGAEKRSLTAAVLLLFAFGAAVERGTVCMSGMLKEWFMSGSAYVWRSILFTVMCLSAMYVAGVSWGLFGRVIVEPYVQNFVFLASGSFLMGVGFIFADGCFIGSLWKMAQGNLINVAGFFGMLIGAGISQAAIAARQPAAAQAATALPNDLTRFLPGIVLVGLLWLAGSSVLALCKPGHYRY